jgi:hypothetical protein
LDAQLVRLAVAGRGSGPQANQEEQEQKQEGQGLQHSQQPQQDVAQGPYYKEQLE